MWSIALVAKETRLVVGSSDRQLRVWAVEHVDAEQELGGATNRAIIGEKRGALLGSDGDEMMEQSDVTKEQARNVRVITFLFSKIWTYNVCLLYMW